MSSRIQEIKMKCPFCKEGEVEISYLAPSTRAKKGTWGGSRPSIIDIPGNTLVLTNRCPNCGKLSKEIKKALDGKVSFISHQERIERMKLSGLPTRIEG